MVSDVGGPLRATREGEKIGVGREHLLFGQIKLPEVRFSAVDNLPPGIKVRGHFTYEVKVTGASGSTEWRIEGPVPEPVVTVDAAIRYVTVLRGNTADPIIRKNVDRTLAALTHFR
jgi:hypothetical protein